MKIYIQAKPNARKEKIEQIDETHFRVAVKEPPVRGRANYAIAKALAEHFGEPVSRVCLLSGSRSRQKVFKILTRGQ